MGLLMCCCSFNSYSSRCVEISLIILNIISFALSAIALYIIKWKNVSMISLIIMLLVLLLSILLFLFSIIIRCWHNSGSIKTTKKESATRLSSAGFALSIILFIICAIGDIVVGIDFNKANYPCGTGSNVDDSFDYFGGYYRRNLIDKNSIDCNNYSGEKPYIEVVTSFEYSIAYFCFSYTEIAMILAIILWRSSKARIINEIDGPIQVDQSAVMQQPVYGAQYPPYGYGQQIQPQYVYVEGSGQYPMQPNMYGGMYNNNQYQQQNIMVVQQGGNGNYNSKKKHKSKVPLGNSQDYSTARNIQ